MKQRLTLLAAVGVIGFFSTAALAQSTPRVEKKRRSLIANNVSFSKQTHLLDSVIAKHMSEDQDDDYLPEGDNPADELYDGAWSSRGVNANRIELSKVPDSVYIDCSGYIPPVTGAITSEFGPRKRRYHYGMDLRLSIGDPVGSAFDGKVRVTKYDRGGYGSYVVIRHNNGLETVYGHLSEIKVFEGQNVRAGQCIGLGGNTGRSTGPHLHFETRFLGNPINPNKFFDFEKGTALANKYLLVKEVAFDYKHYKKGKNRGEHEETTAEETVSTGKHGRHGKDKSVSARAQFHKVKNGETLSHIADRYNVSIDKLCKMNKISRTTLLKPGKKIKYS
jgi:murein DD-endopeptidase MepM/ murein hydrolase activator NlpD